MSDAIIPRTLRLLAAIRRHVDADISVQRLQVLLVCMAHPHGIDQGTLVKSLNQSRSAVSKNVADLTRLTSKKLEGPGLLCSEPDPMNLVSRIITVTPKGRELWALVLREVG